MAKQRKNQGKFAGIQKAAMESERYVNLSYSARALLLELALQYNFYNNGKLCAIHDQLKDRGFKSDKTITNCLKELKDSGLIMVSKLSPRGSRKPHYYAITWQPIDDIPGFEMDIKSTDMQPVNFAVENANKRKS